MHTRLTLRALTGVLAFGLGTAVAASPEGKPVDPNRPAATRTVPTGEPTGTTAPGTTGTPGSVVNDTARIPGRSPGATGEVHGTTGQPTSAPSTGTTVGTATGTVALSPAESKAAKKILTDVHNVNLTEIALGRLAQTKAESQGVKDYAQHLITDHEAADRKVTEFANSKNILLTSALTGAAAEPSRGGVPSATGTTTAGTSAGVATGTTPAGTAAPAGTPVPGGTAAGTGAASDAAPGVDQLDAEGRRAYTKLDKLTGAKFDKAFLTEMVKGHSKTLAKLKGAEKRTKNEELKTLLGDISGSVQMHLDKAKELQRGGAASLSAPAPTQASIQ